MNSESAKDVILIVDDEPVVRDLLNRIAKTVPRVTTSLAAGAEEALRLAEQNPPSLIISDLNMPDKTGQWLLEQIRMRNAAVPFVVFSGSLTGEDESALLRKGATSVVGKPATPVTLRSIMTGLLSRAVRLEMVAHVGSEVYVAGTFNNWNPLQYRMQDEPHAGIFSITMHLPRGRYEYKFIVDGEWQVDPRNPLWAPNGLSTTNSVMEV